MFTINDDMSIYVSRGDAVFFAVKADDGGTPYVFQPGDVIRMKITEKKNCNNVVMQKDFPIVEATVSVTVALEEKDTKIGGVISKPVDYWYEVELNPFTDPQTIIGYDDDGAKIFRLFPEGRDLTTDVKEEDIPPVDDALSLTSERPVQNQAVTRAITELSGRIAIESFEQSHMPGGKSIIRLSNGEEIYIYNGTSGSDDEQISGIIERYLQDNPIDLPLMDSTTLGCAKLGDNLKIDASGRLSVDTTDKAEVDNTKPITSAAVHTIVGNIETLLNTL